MNAYLFSADIYCEDCGQNLQDDLDNELDDGEDREDSENYPQGPYPDGAGEADTPQHCADCGDFLQNPLTAEGEKYVLEAMAKTDHGDPVDQWVGFYDHLIK